MVEAKITACAKVPKELYDASIQKYTKISVAIIAGLELLRENDSIQNSIQNQDDSIQNQDDSIQNQDDSIQNQGSGIPNQSDSIRDEGVKLGENGILKAENERLQDINEILRANIQELKKDKDTIQNLYNNYMLQMQTLINQRAIEAPGAKKPWWRFW